MGTSLQLSSLTEGVLREIGEFGLCPELNHQYRRIYDRIGRFAASRNLRSYSADLVEGFLAEVEHRHEKGAIGPQRRSHLRRAALLLRDFAETGVLEWKTYGGIPRSTPSSPALLRSYSHYMGSLEAHGRCPNTIASSRNLVRQFLLFLENNGYTALSEAPAEVVPSFFRHLANAYRPTSIRTVASHIRCFLRFSDGGERLLPLVPSRCPRGRPIIPILSQEEHTALKRVLHSAEVPLRDKAIIGLALQTGVRSIDIVRMKLSDIDWVNDTVLIRQAKTGRPYEIPLSPAVGNSLSSYILTERPPSDSPCVFLRSVAPFRALSDHAACYAVVCRIFGRAGIRLGDERKGLHVLRHSAASRMLSCGVPVTTISCVLGHSNKSSTDVYLATDERRMRECGLPLTGIPMNCGGLK